jgi:F0F1-type ATP synthase membrane subunit b/b'
MTTSRPQAEIREELQRVEEDLAQLRETAASLRERIGERADDPTDAEEHSTLIETAEEQEFLAEQLEARREELLRELGETGHQSADQVGSG